MYSLRGSVLCAHPDPLMGLSHTGLRSFEGSLKLTGYPRASPLDATNFIVRGTRMCGIDFIFGFVIYVGPDSYCYRLPRYLREDKRSFLESIINKASVMLIILVFVCAMIDLRQILVSAEDYESIGVMAGGIAIVRYAYLLPLSLPILLDLVHLIQARKIRNDHQRLRDTFVGTPSVIDNLGSIDVAFVDPTRTLVTSDLRFVGCSIGTHDYGLHRKLSFLDSMAFSNTNELLRATPSPSLTDISSRNPVSDLFSVNISEDSPV